MDEEREELSPSYRLNDMEPIEKEQDEQQQTARHGYTCPKETEVGAARGFASSRLLWVLPQSRR